MQTGALIVAAGKSSRMGDFKPMLQLGSISIAQRVINNFRQAGISKIVVSLSDLSISSTRLFQDIGRMFWNVTLLPIM